MGYTDAATSLICRPRSWNSEPLARRRSMNIVSSILKKLAELLLAIVWVFYKPNPTVYVEPLDIPHPENYADGDNIDESVEAISGWLKHWSVPAKYHTFWWGVTRVVVENYKYPASITDLNPNTTGDEVFTLNPWWDTEGVCAHELGGHINWFYLTKAEREEFKEVSDALMKTSPLLQKLFAWNGYGLTSTVERHAEIYRYIGQYMHPDLKKFYPKCF